MNRSTSDDAPETLADLTAAFDDTVDATLHRADDGDLPGGHDTVVASGDTAAIVDFVESTCLHVFAADAAEVTVVDPEDVEWLSA